MAATHVGLAPSTVQRLAADADPDVRHLLAFNHPDAPPQLLIDAFLACHRQRQLLLAMPALPRTGLKHLADDANPEVRALAAGDATLPASVHERLLADDDVRVHRAAAANPVILAERLEALLEDAELAEAAAANPNLTNASLHTLLDRAGIPPSPSSARSARQA